MNLVFGILSLLPFLEFGSQLLGSLSSLEEEKVILFLGPTDIT
jgi:hypothetical protein